MPSIYTGAMGCAESSTVLFFVQISQKPPSQCARHAGGGARGRGGYASQSHVVRAGASALLSRSGRNGRAGGAFWHHAVRSTGGVCVRGSQSQGRQEEKAGQGAAGGAVLPLGCDSQRSHTKTGFVRRRDHRRQRCALRQRSVRVRAQAEPRHARVPEGRLRGAADHGRSHPAAGRCVLFRFLARGLRSSHQRVHPHRG